ncbi:hypothetical protein [Pedobacter sp. SL55]|uniref:hypothetical protein n=1 Tax=Pedobacter sp. SL55 TaxID=2995161 RepID=UPI00226F4DB2|nr:hypothetical protein [Pedobacter sp. SL55]WAC39046.1 hypothetical protein OVA16_10500 [Pedobacter sp. SL55]
MLNLKKYFSAACHQPYPSACFLSPVLLFLVHFLITFEEKKELSVIMTNFGYYRALLFSWMVAVGLVWWVRKKSIQLDASLAWREAFAQRLKNQLLYGIFYPLVLAMAIATLYFLYFRINILHTVYFRRYFPLISLFLVLLNTLVFAWNQHFRKDPTMPTPPAPIKDVARQPLHAKKVSAKLQTANHLMDSQIACVYMYKGVCHYVTLSGEFFLWPGNFEDAEHTLGADFFTIRRSVMVSRLAIKEAQPEEKLMRVVLGFEVPVSLVVSYRNLVGFKNWLNAEEEEASVG